MNPVILDTGPLVAWFCPRDTHHAWARQAFGQITSVTVTCEAVLAEVCHLVAKDGIAGGKVIEFVERAGLIVTPMSNEMPALRIPMNRYADAPMDFADACVVRLAELHPTSTVCTTDSHFKFFRAGSTKVIPMLAPSGL